MNEDADWVARYLDFVRVEKRLAPRSLTLYTLHLQTLCEGAAQAGVALLQVQNLHIRRWVVQMHSRGRNGRGIALVLSVWRGFFSWVGRQGVLPSNPVHGVRAPKSAKPLPKALAVDDAVQFAEFAASVDSADEEGAWLQARDTAMVELLYSSGLRVGELVGLDVVASRHAKGWVDMAAAQAHVLGKGSKRRTVPVGSAALQALQEWLQWRGAMGTGAVAGAAQGAGAAVQASQADAAAALFLGRYGTRLTAQSVWQRLRRRSLQAGMAGPVHPHMLRHSFASHVLQSSGDLRGVQELLGHANISTTQVYTRLDFQHLAQTYDAAHPRAKLKTKP
jgi:integrase/recombinase XerC